MQDLLIAWPWSKKSLIESLIACILCDPPVHHRLCLRRIFSFDRTSLPPTIHHLASESLLPDRLSDFARPPLAKVARFYIYGVTRQVPIA